MNEKIKEHLKQYNLSKGYGIEDCDLIETIQEAKQVYKNNGDKHRWWIEYFYVVEVDGMYIGYVDAESTGDSNAQELGYEFDLTSICECEKQKQTLIVVSYKPKE